MNDRTEDRETRDLSDALDRATAGVAAPGLADRALRAAQRRRRRRQGLAAASVAAVAVLGVVTTVVGGPALVGPTPPTGAPTPSGTSPADPGPPSQEPGPTTAEPISPDDVQPGWDPDDVEDLAWADGPGLPRDLTIGGSAEGGAARGVAVVDGALRVLGPDGWYVGPDLPAGVGGTPSVAISPDGSRIAVVGTDGLAVLDDEWTALPLPEGYSSPSDFPAALSFVDDDRLLVGQSTKFWEVDVDAGSSVRLPFDRIDEVVPAGDAIVADRYSATEPGTLARWRAGRLERLGDTTALESTQRPASDGVSLATVRANGVTYGDGDTTDTDGLLALTLDGLDVRGFLPVPSRGSYYSDNANLTPLGFTDPDTVLAEVRPSDSVGTTWLITWQVETGELRKVASYPTDQPRFALALDVLGES